ncbi:hypothetical protein EDB85DRAFT_276099 [Lactarius pseudohatsudake]|nr:hypothetical protein EDB85DRAFT_276099 [Lactarius pseudohatsudake]
MVRRRRGGMGSGATMMTMQRRDGQVATLPPPTLGIRQLEQENPQLLRKNNEPRQQLHMQTRWTSLLTGPHFDMPIAAPSTYLSYLSADYPECDLKRWCRLRVCPPQRRSRVPQTFCYRHRQTAVICPHRVPTCQCSQARASSRPTSTLCKPSWPVACERFGHVGC